VRVVLAEDSVLLREGIARLLPRPASRSSARPATPRTCCARSTRATSPTSRSSTCGCRRRTDEGLRAAAEARAAYPELGVLVLSQYVEPVYAAELLGGRRAGGIGYLLKDRVADVEALRRAVRRVAAGGTALDPEVVAQLLGRAAVTTRSPALTPREREVLALMAEGRTNAGIARQLVVTPGAVEKHISNIFGKLGLAAGEDDHRRVLAVLTYLRAS
jgi:DNA-binding NarL/FixJ family response regulator